jgi:hypothetical protein
MSKTPRTIALVGLALAWIGHAHGTAVDAAGSQATAPGAAAAPRQAPNVAAPAPAISRSLIDQYCVTCHNERLKTAGLVLEKIDVANPGAHAEVLEKVVRKLRSGQMPPDGRPRPDKATVTAYVAALETALDRVAAASPNPGRVAVHRLNRAEYVNAIRDLLALEIDGPQLLPVDNSGFGFDNIADVLTIAPGLMSRYMSTATKVSRLAVGSPDIRAVNHVYRASEFAQQDARMNEDLPFASHGGMAIRHAFPLDGEYTFKIRLQRNLVGDTIRGIDDEHEIELRLDHALVKRFKVGGEFRGPDPGILIAIPEDDVEAKRLHTYRLTADNQLEVRFAVKAGTRLVGVAFTDVSPSAWEGVPLRPRSIKNAVFSDDAGDPGVDTVEISGPHNARVPDETASRQQIFTCRPTGKASEEPCATKILGTLARRAYRRPVTDADVAPLLKLYQVGREESDFDAGIERALEALLSSPGFLFRIEQDPANAAPGSVYRVTDLELASRLSFFLWKSIPDDELIEVAARGRLRNPAVLTQQVRRMLADQRASRWMTDFMGQWLLVRNAQTAEPDPTRFPEFDDTLRQAMVRETELFFENQVRENRSVFDLLRADYTFLNARLAKHYGIPNVYGSHFRRVKVTDPARQGLLGHASILTVTSYADRTSVVLRGKWVLESLVGAPPPPPPPNVPPLRENDGKSKPASLRERMEQHRANPVCAACHSQMDPLGFALEHFDPTGRWRETDGGAVINSAITLDGVKIDGPKEFREALVTVRGREFIRTVTEKLLTYALRRGVEHYDAPTVRQIVRDAAADEYRWSSVIMGIVKSLPFQMRKVVPPDETAPASAVPIAQRR